MQLSNTPQTNNDSDKLLLILVEGLKEAPTLKFMAQLATELRVQVTDTTSQIEAVTEEKVNFAQAQEVLGESFDLETVLTRAATEYKRWGRGELDTEAVKSGLTFSPFDLERLKQNPELGSEVHLRVLDTGQTEAQNNQNRWNALEKVISADQMYRWNSKNLSEFFVVDVTGSKATSQTPSAQFEMVFTPEERNLIKNDLPEEAKKHVGIDATKQREHMQSSVNFVSPDVWMDMFNRGMDNLVVDFDDEVGDLEALYALSNNEYANKCQTALKEASADQIKQFLPDSKTITQFPDLAHKDGVVPRLYFSPDNRRVDLDDCSPDYAFDYLGTRLRLG